MTITVKYLELSKGLWHAKNVSLGCWIEECHCHRLGLALLLSNTRSHAVVHLHWIPFLINKLDLEKFCYVLLAKFKEKVKELLVDSSSLKTTCLKQEWTLDDYFWKWMKQISLLRRMMAGIVRDQQRSADSVTPVPYICWEFTRKWTTTMFASLFVLAGGIHTLEIQPKVCGLPLLGIWLSRYFFLFFDHLIKLYW